VITAHGTPRAAARRSRWRKAVTVLVPSGGRMDGEGLEKCGRRYDYDFKVSEDGEGAARRSSSYL
jgi:hypothetical protein